MNKDLLEKIAMLEEWLTRPNELGVKPFNIVYTNKFVDDERNDCYIFKYKKAMVGPWLLAIVSESGIFSEMKRYYKDTEIEDAKILLNTLKNN